jgi:hypothetical protein
MRLLLIVFVILLTSCGQDRTQINVVEKDKAKISKPISSKSKYHYTGNQKGFEPIPYSTSYNYADTIAKKLVPNAKWQYWAYVRYRQSEGPKTDVFTILSEQGDFKYRKYIKKRPKNDGFFQGCHPHFCCNFAVVVKNDSVRYITTEETFRDFIGDVNNLEEAMLLAKTYGYVLGDSIISARYKIVNGNYEMNLLKAPEFAESRMHPKSEAAEVIVTPKAFVKIKSLGVYCEGRGCY